MAYTYSKIASVTVGSGGSSSIEFLAIPQNYTDLIIKLSSRRSTAGINGTYSLTFNNDSNSTQTARRLMGDGASATSASFSVLYGGEGTGDGATANTYSNVEIYISNYSSINLYKSISIDSVGENNATTAYANFTAALYSSSKPVTQISIVPGSGNFMQYSTATLYGIKAEV